MKVLKIVPLEWGRHSRNTRELNAYRELGMDVVIINKGRARDFFKKREADGFLVYDITTRPLGENVSASINRVLTVFLWAYYVRKIHPDVIDGHNLIALQIGYLAYFFVPQKNKPKFIYDSHEFELARTVQYGRDKVRRLARQERFLMRRCSFSTVISEGIASAVQRIYKLNQKPIVIRSTPYYWELNQEEIKRIRKEYEKIFGIRRKGFIVEYHGYIQEYRGLEEIIEALSLLENVYLVMIGDAQKKEYEDEIKKKITSYNLESRVLRYPAMPLDELKNYIAATDCGLVMNNGDNPNYHYALPNKFFENIQAMNPIICSNLPELTRLVDEYNIGLTVPYGSPNRLAEAITNMWEDKGIYQQFKQNLVNAKDELCWEKEKEKLKKVFMETIIKK